MTGADIADGAGARIAAYRTVDVTLTLRDPTGDVLSAGSVVAVEQVRHQFLFGCNTYSWGRCGTPEDDRAYADRFRALFNYATLPVYWGPTPFYPRVEPYESARGATREGPVRDLVTWCARHGITTKGHPLIFFREPAWLTSLSPGEMEELLWARITREVAALAGLIDIWDVVNEPTNVLEDAPANGGYASLQLYRRHGAVGVIRKAFALARAANPHAMLILNEVDMSSRFLDLVARCLDAGAPIDAIGLQAHELNAYSSAEELWALCERFGRFGLPLHFTELMFPSGDAGPRAAFDWAALPGWVTTEEGERRQAAEVADMYRVLFSHPAVAAITWWDFADRGACLDIPDGLLRRDLTPKPAYEALMSLIKGDWWTRTETTVRPAGEARLRGFLGQYRVRADAADGRAPLLGAFELRADGRGPVEVRLSPAGPSDG